MRRLIVAVAVVALAVAASSTAAPQKANIYVVASKSFCLGSGIADAYTGEGKIIFYMTFKNSGSSVGKVNVIPVRYYDDGNSNASAMDMMEISVPARTTKRFKSPMFKYKAHEHEIAGCALKIGSRAEVKIASSHL